MISQPHVLLAFGNYDYHTHRGVADYAGRHGWHLHSEMCFGGQLPRGWSGDGILTALGSQYALVRFIREAKVPVVDISLSRQDIFLPRVVGDHHRIGVLGAEHFLGRGFRHFAWHASGISPAGRLRWEGFASTLARAGLESELWIWQAGIRRPTDLWRAKCQWLAKNLQAIPKPAAVFAYRDIDGANVLDAALSAGLSVPDEVAILGVDNNELVCETLGVPLSSVQHDLERIGREASALLDRLMQKETAPKMPILIPPRGVVVRRSTDAMAVHHEGCRRALGFLQASFPKNIGVSDAVQISGLSRRGLELAFQEHLGRSIGKELSRVRLAKVKELLLQTRLPVVEIAAQTGFHSPQYLNLIFSKATGFTPHKFRVAYSVRHPAG